MARRIPEQAQRSIEEITDAILTRRPITRIELAVFLEAQARYVASQLGVTPSQFRAGVIANG